MTILPDKGNGLRALPFHENVERMAKLVSFSFQSQHSTSYHDTVRVQAFYHLLSKLYSPDLHP